MNILISSSLYLVTHRRKRLSEKRICAAYKFKVEKVCDMERG